MAALAILVSVDRNILLDTSCIRLIYDYIPGQRLKCCPGHNMPSLPRGQILFGPGGMS